jgi:hypothetical protein
MKTLKLDRNQLEASSKLSPMAKASVLPASQLPTLSKPALATAVIETSPKTNKPKSKKPEAAPAARDIKQYLLHIPEDKQTAYEKRFYLKSAYNLPDATVDATERAKTTFYRDEQGKLQLWNLPTARKLIKAYINSKKPKSFTSDDVETLYKVFGPGISDNTLNACRKFQKQGFLSMRKDPPDVRRFHYVMTVLKQIPEELSV